MAQTLKDALAKVDGFSLNAIILSKGLTPLDDSYDSDTGGFIAFDEEEGQGAAFWVKDGQLYSTVPAIMGDDVDTLRDQQLNTTAELHPVGLFPLGDD